MSPSSLDEEDEVETVEEIEEAELTEEESLLDEEDETLVSLQADKPIKEAITSKGSNVFFMGS